MSAAGLLCSLVLATGAQAATFSIGYAAQDDIGTTSADSAFAPFSSSTFPNTPFLPASGVPTCGDVLIFKGATNGALGAGAGNLSDTSSANGTGLEFHVEDSSGAGTQNVFLRETLTVGTTAANFDLPYTVNFGTSADTFQIHPLDTKVCVGGTGGNCTGGINYWIISPGTALFTRPRGSDDDDWALETNLVGCVNTTASGLGSCGSTLAPFISFSVGDPPAPAVPESSTLAVFLFAVIAFGTLQNWRRSSWPLPGSGLGRGDRDH